MLTLSPNIMVEDVEEAIAFYQGQLGFQVAMTVPDKGKADWVLLRKGQVNLMCQSRRSFEGDIPSLRGKLLGGTVSFYCQMKGVDDLYDHLLGKVKMVKTIETTFYGTTEFTMQDPFGYIFTFAEEN